MPITSALSALKWLPNDNAPYKFMFTYLFIYLFIYLLISVDDMCSKDRVLPLVLQSEDRIAYRQQRIAT